MRKSNVVETLTVVFVKDSLESVGHLLLAFRVVDDDGHGRALADVLAVVRPATLDPAQGDGSAATPLAGSAA